MPVKNKRKPLIIIIIIEIGIFITLLGTIAILYQHWRANPSSAGGLVVNALTYNDAETQDDLLTLFGPTLTQAAKLGIAEDILEPLETTPFPFPTDTPGQQLTATPTPVTLCGGPPVMMILALGIDTLQDTYRFGLADAIRIVRVDFVQVKVTTLALPRDLWVEIPGLSEQGITDGKLNMAYAYGAEYYGFYDGPDLGPGLMMETLALNYDLEIDKYISLNMATFERVIDAVGGVDVYVPYDVDGKSTDPNDVFDLGYFERGNHHFDGETAVRFSRIRMIDDGFERANRQSWVLRGLWKKFTNPFILPRIPQVINAFEGSVQYNLSVGDLGQLICLAPQLTSEKITLLNVPRDMLEEDRIFVERYKKSLFYWKIDHDAFVQFLADFRDGTWPVQEP